MMKIQTKYCGRMQYAPDEVIHFPDGLFGFEQFHDFILIRLEDDANSPFCLQSIQETNLAFILFDPFQLVPAYAPDVPDADCVRLEDPSADHLVLYVICNLQDPMPESTVNLRSPIALNVRTHTALQTILPAACGYSFRTKFSALAKGGDTQC